MASGLPNDGTPGGVGARSGGEWEGRRGSATGEQFASGALYHPLSKDVEPDDRVLFEMQLSGETVKQSRSSSEKARRW